VVIVPIIEFIFGKVLSVFLKILLVLLPVFTGLIAGIPTLRLPFSGGILALALCFLALALTFAGGFLALTLRLLTLTLTFSRSLIPLPLTLGSAFLTAGLPSRTLGCSCLPG